MRTSVCLALLGVMAAPLIACSGKYVEGTGDGGGGSGASLVGGSGGTHTGGSGGSGGTHSGGSGGTPMGGYGGTSMGGYGGTSMGGYGGTPMGGYGGTSMGGYGGTPMGGYGGTSMGGYGGGVMAECTSDGYTDPVCGNCMEANCAAQCTTCLHSAACVNWLQCVANCSDSACQDVCTQQYPDGAAPAQDWIVGCLGAYCGVECGPGGDCGLSTGGSIPECDTCISQNCCDQGIACASDQGCIDVLYCTNTCTVGDAACEQACYDASPASGQLLDQFLGCLKQDCAVECGQ